MITQFAITFGAWLILLWVSINLIGMLVRGLALTSEMKKILVKGSQALREVVAEFYKPSEERRTNFVAIVLIAVFLGALYFFWNIGVVITATIIMVARIPDLLWEIRHGGVGGNRENRADVLSRPNALNGKYAAATNGYGLGFGGTGEILRNKGVGLLRRADLADKVIAFAEKNGMDTKNPVDATLLGKFVVSMTREGKISRSRYAEMSSIYMLTILVTLATLPMLWYTLFKL